MTKHMLAESAEASDEQRRRAMLADVRALQSEIGRLGIAIDADGLDPAPSLKLISETGVQAVSVPIEFGGLWDGTTFGGWDVVCDAAISIAAGDGSTGQCWLTTNLVAREIFLSGLPESTKADIAREILTEGRRLVASNSETGSPRPVTARRVPGGLEVTGVKTFNTNSGGGGRDIANVGVALESDDGSVERRHALIRLDADGVTLHGNWDNMGQRGTISQSITYDHVFVPNGWHMGRVIRNSDDPIVGLVFSIHAMILQGIGEGALAAITEHLRKVPRASAPMFSDAGSDPLLHIQLGDLESTIAASRALLEKVCRRLTQYEEGADFGPLLVEVVESKIASTVAGLEVAAHLHELCGARSTANAHRLDRYWRNARTFASHDSLAAKKAFVGASALTGSPVDFDLYYRG